MISSNNSIQGKVGSNKLQGFGVHARGPEGNGIEKIELTNTVDLVNTYTITFTNGKTTTFEVHNGKDGIDGVNGKDGENGKSLEFNWQGTSLGIRVEGTEEYIYIDLKGEKGEKGDPAIDIIDNLESDSAEAGLSARQGKELHNKILGTHATVTVETAISQNTNYTIPISYIVGSNDLEVRYEGCPLIKDVHYIEVGTAGQESTTVQFKDWQVDIGETISFVRRG